MEHFHNAEELKMKLHWRAIYYLQDSEVLESSKIHLGDFGDIISVQVTVMERNLGKIFADYTCGLFNPDWLGLEDVACQGEGNSND